jgi:hypothetical protein
MSKANQIWKFSWNPSGYYTENNYIDLSKKYLNNEIYLNHTYFNDKRFVIYSYLSDKTKRFYNIHTTLQANTDFLFVGLDEELTKIAGTNIYSKLKMVSLRVQELNEVYVDCTFIADVIDASSIGQDLSTNSDVEHKSLTLKENLVVPKGIIDTLQVNSFNGSFGNISKDEIKLVSSTLNLNDELFISKSGLITDNDKVQFGSEKYNISFHPETKSVTLKAGDKREGILFRGPQLENIPVYGIPVILSDDKTKLSFVPWLCLEPDNKRIKLGNININDSSFLQDNKFEFAKDYIKASMTICDVPFITVDREKNFINIFNDVIKINLTTKDVIMNGFTFNPSFFSSILQMQRDINFLKSKIN